MDPQEETITKPSHAFYREALEILKANNFAFLIGGAFALRQHTGLYRDTKDLDVFCKAGEYPRILKTFADQGYKTEITDARWLAKVFKDDYYVDFIFNTPNNICQVDDNWFKNAVQGELYGIATSFVAPEELIWCKIYVQDRYHYDAADINHTILKRGKDMDWKRVLSLMDQHWHLLLAQFLNFQFIYPSERDAVPRWLFDELLKRARDQYDLPVPMEKVCRGPLIDHTQYNTDITDWEYKIITVKRF